MRRSRGAAVGLLIGVRILGFTLFAGAVAMRGADLVAAAVRGLRMTRAAFALTAIPTALMAMPYLLGEPPAFFSGFGELAEHPLNIINQLFMGEVVSSADNPAFYIHVWMLTTTPPMTLALAVVGGGKTPA